MKKTLFAAFIVVAAGCQQPATETPPPPTQIVATAPAKVPQLLPGQKEPAADIISGGQPSADALSAIRDAGYRTVINLRLPSEKGQNGEAEIVDGLGMTYVSIPVGGAAGLTKENVGAFAAALEGAEYPLAIHCGSGNRIGAMFALKAFWLEGKSAEEALQIGRDSGMTRLERDVTAILDAASSN